MDSKDENVVAPGDSELNMFLYCGPVVVCVRFRGISEGNKPPYRCGPIGGPVDGVRDPTEFTVANALPVPFHFGRCISMHVRPLTVVHLSVVVSGVVRGRPFGSEVSL